MNSKDRRGHLVPIHPSEDYEGMRKAGALAAEVLDYITDFVDVGVSTGKLNDLCHAYILDKGAIPAPLNYKGFPKATCISINHVICHGIPGDKRVQNGDILNIDVTVIVDGWHGDSSRMYAAGKTSRLAQRLMDVTYDCLMLGIEAVKPGATLGDVGYAIQSKAEGERFSVVEDFCGHGLGQKFHEPPNVVHYGKAGEGLVLEEGMFFTIEPMINVGKKGVVLLADGWTAVTKDKKLSAQYEHSLAVTADGFEIFTASAKGYTKFPYV
ncbi:MAG: type I methionyl aminopeptidase [Alphaproteobacteria bacterium]